jgi:hypothetical protein
MMCAFNCCTEFKSKLALFKFFFFYKKNCGGVCIKELASRRGLL